MAFDWNEFLTLAKRLAQANDDASLRSAISRAYYAAYHHARRYVVQKLGVFVPKTEAHHAVWSTLQAPGVKRPEKTAGIHGQKLREARNRADYELVFGGDPQRAAAEAIKTSETIIGFLAMD